jgi:hypothetical protein
MITNKSLQWIVLCICTAAFLAACAQPASISENQQNSEILNRRRAISDAQAKLNIYYNNTAGKVGYHFVSQPRADCQPQWNSNNPKTVSTMPPGLELNGYNIEGTPEAPGNWLVTIRFDGISCHGKSYPAEDVTLLINIQGDAPRKVK